MNNIEYIIDLLKEKDDYFNSESKYYFDARKSTLNINVDSVIFDKHNKTYNLENQIISINVFLFRYKKNEVIPFDEYQCCVAIKQTKKNTHSLRVGIFLF